MNIIFIFLIIFSFIGLIIVIGRKIPKLARLTEEELFFWERKKSLAQKYKEINHHQFRANLMASLEKLLRRAKVWSLKMENLLSQWIKKSREKSRLITQKSKQIIEEKAIKTKPKKMLSEFLQDKIWSKAFKKETDDTPLKDQGKAEAESEAVSLEKPQATLTDLSKRDSQISIADLGKPIKEEQQWIDLIIKNPKNVTAYKSLGMLYWKQHNYSDAKASLEMAIKLGSRDKKAKEVLEELKKMEAEE